MKVLILALSGGGDEHLQNEMAQRESWAANLPENFQIYWLVADPLLGQTSISRSDRRIYTPMQEVYSNLLPKSLMAMRHSLQAFDFDFLIRTNTTSYFSTPLIEKTLEEFSTKELYGGVEGFFKREQKGTNIENSEVGFISGAGIWLSRKVTETLIQMDYRQYHDLVDDVAIGGFLSNRIDRTILDRVNVTDFEPVRPAAHTRIKHWKKNHISVRRMLALHQVYQSRTRAEIANSLRAFDKIQSDAVTKPMPTNPGLAMRVIQQQASSRESRIQAFCDNLLM
jgi:hypothetical protein